MFGLCFACRESGWESAVVVLVGEVIGDNVGEVLTCASRSVRVCAGAGLGMKFAFHYHQKCIPQRISPTLNPVFASIIPCKYVEFAQ